MFTRRQPVIEMLDRGASLVRNAAMRLPGARQWAANSASPSRRPRRYRSLFVLVMVVAGLGMLTTGLRYTGFITMSVASFLSRLAWTQGALVEMSVNRDERETALFIKSRAIGFAAAQGLTFLTFIYLAFAIPSPELAHHSIAQGYGHNVWFPRDVLDWVALATGLQTIADAMSAVWANWSVPADHAIWAEE